MSLTSEQASQLVKSRRWPRGSFEARIGGVTLPGDQSPEAFLDHFDIKKVDGEAALIAGQNGALSAELLERGADLVSVFEVRPQFRDSHEILADHLPHGDRVLKFKNWPHEIETDLSGSHDVVVCLQGWQNFTRHPVTVLNTAYQMLSPGGRLLVFLKSGRDNIVKEPSNAWWPKVPVFENFFRKLGGKIEKMNTTKLQGRFYYLISKPLGKMAAKKDDAKVEDQPKAKEKVETPTKEGQNHDKPKVKKKPKAKPKKTATKTKSKKKSRAKKKPKNKKRSEAAKAAWARRKAKHKQQKQQE